ncbi:MAG: nucleotidyltransferase family protein, partial [Armatimonadota bacterium]|nr:nucleotidyltransferase family protein [Armatimonadota bacterium]
MRDSRSDLPEFRFLTALVGQALGCSAPASLPTLTADEWARFSELAGAHRVQPLAYQAFKADAATVPPDVMSRLQAEAQRCWIHSTMLAQELARISRLLGGEGIPLAAMKGPALATQVYGSITARTMGDLDILVRPSEFARARALLEANDFVWEETVAALPLFYQDLYARQAHHFTFRQRRLGYPLEVHVRASSGPAYFPIPVEELLADAQPVSVAGVDVPTLSLRHHFLFVAAHGAKHGWWRLQWVADFAAFSQRCPAWFDESNVGDGLARAWGLQSVLDAAFDLSHRCFDTPVPDGGSPQASRRPLARYGIRSLARGHQPQTFGEKAEQVFHFLRLRSGPGYVWEVFRFCWNVTPEDFARFPLPGKWAALYPALRPWLWLAR